MQDYESMKSKTMRVDFVTSALNCVYLRVVMFKSFAGIWKINPFINFILYRNYVPNYIIEFP
jgi:hypothetical protein